MRMEEENFFILAMTAAVSNILIYSYMTCHMYKKLGNIPFVNAMQCDDRNV